MDKMPERKGKQDESPDKGKSGDDILHDPNVPTEDDEETIEAWLHELEKEHKQ